MLYDNLGDAYFKNNLTNEAIEAWEKSLQVDPNAPTAAQVRNKIRDAREQQLRVKGAPPKAQQR